VELTKTKGLLLNACKRGYGIGKFADLLNVDTGKVNWYFKEIGIRLDKRSKTRS
jgi:hypothetical protein